MILGFMFRSEIAVSRLSFSMAPKKVIMIAYSRARFDLYEFQKDLEGYFPESK